VQILRVLSIFLLILNVSLVYATNGPKLNFTDLVNGPSTGLGDGLGSGVIVTIWGQNLLSEIGSSTIVFTDGLGEEHNPAHIYYWKNADGLKPSGVANLYASHKMQEVAFSIPDVLDGNGFIHVVVNGEESNKLPFLVRSGVILHIKETGNDDNPGTFGSAFKSLPKTVSIVSKRGATIYVHDDLLSEDLNHREVVYWNRSSASSGRSNHYSIVAYPSSQPTVIGRIGFASFNTEGQLVSKIKILASNCDEGPNGQPTNCIRQNSAAIFGTKHGRIISNVMSDRPNGCAESELGAITGDKKQVHGLKIFGNEIFDYGCEGTSKFHHTTYIKIRASWGLEVDPWEFGWNYLHDNKAKNGIHQFDLKSGSDNLCGTPNATVKIHENVIVNQSGAGIFVGTNCEWSNTFEIYNNLIINSGLPADWNGIDPKTSKDANTNAISITDYNGLLADFNIYNNTIYDWPTTKINQSGRACFSFDGGRNASSAILNSNLCITNNDERFIFESNLGTILDRSNSSNNAWYYTGEQSSAINAIQPDIGNDVMDDPKVNFNGIDYSISSGSPLINNSNTSLVYDLYGNKRSVTPTVGAVEFIRRPNPPSSLVIQ
jgi:hypothetical protein